MTSATMPPAIPTARRASMPKPGPAWSPTSAPSPNSRATAMASAPSSTRTPAATSSSRTSSTASPPTCRPNLPVFASTPATSTIPGWTRSRRSGATPTALDYIHFKDIDPAVYADVMGRRIRFFDACGEGVMCPIGRGRIDYPGLRAAADRTRLRRIHHHRAGARSAQHRQHPRGPRGEPGPSCATPASERGMTR